MKGLIEGRIVHYVNTDPDRNPKWHEAAIVNMVHADQTTVSLTVFTPDKTHIATCVRYDPTAQKSDSWHWIEGTNEALKAETEGSAEK